MKTWRTLPTKELPREILVNLLLAARRDYAEMEDILHDELTVKMQAPPPNAPAALVNGKPYRVVYQVKD